uniref:ShKT domain-containing protein n=1 Tax=Parastrongyloides trichosuri TaxID=131310 RepID=A0A0N4ZE44_PARTI
MIYFILFLVIINCNYFTDSICIDLSQSCGSMRAYCNNVMYSGMMAQQCSRTCGFCIRISGGGANVQNVNVNQRQITSIGPCLNGQCPAGYTCVNGNCYSINEIVATTSTTTTSRPAICIDVSPVCPMFANNCVIGPPRRTAVVIRNCPRTCGVCVFRGK